MPYLKIKVMTKERFYEELQQRLCSFQKYHLQIVLGNFDTKIRIESVFKPTIGSDNLYENNNDNMKIIIIIVLRVIKFATSKNLFFKSAKVSSSKHA